MKYEIGSRIVIKSKDEIIKFITERGYRTVDRLMIYETSSIDDHENMEVAIAEPMFKYCGRRARLMIYETSSIDDHENMEVAIAEPMFEYCGRRATIVGLHYNTPGKFKIDIDGKYYYWISDWFKPEVHHIDIMEDGG